MSMAGLACLMPLGEPPQTAEARAWAWRRWTTKQQAATRQRETKGQEETYVVRKEHREGCR